MKPSITKLLLPITAAALVAGCASSGVKNPSGVPVTRMNADEQGFVAGTGIESQDLVAVTDKMARSILGIQQIANAVALSEIAGRLARVAQGRRQVAARFPAVTGHPPARTDRAIPLAAVKSSTRFPVALQHPWTLHRSTRT
jgi:hypothetical protein